MSNQSNPSRRGLGFFIRVDPELLSVLKEHADQERRELRDQVVIELRRALLPKSKARLQAVG